VRDDDGGDANGVARRASGGGAGGGDGDALVAHGFVVGCLLLGRQSESPCSLL
jgi:hypothetical protein